MMWPSHASLPARQPQPHGDSDMNLNVQRLTLACLHRSHGRNAFPPHYAGINEQVLPAELFASYTAVEYVPPPPPHAPPPLPPAFVFVLDLALDPKEIEVRCAHLPVNKASGHLPMLPASPCVRLAAVR